MKDCAATDVLKSSVLISQFNDELTQITADLSCEGSAFFVGLSGGVDSCALLKLLAQFCDGTHTPVYALHFNHQLQDSSSDWRDFCQKYANKEGCHFRSIDADINVDKKQGLESSARKARYNWFGSVMQDVCEQEGYKNAVLFTGHHVNDQAETVLMNILRGTGINGLRGIARIQNRETSNGLSYDLVRPLLSFTKVQLLNYMQAHDESWIEDPSNQDSQFRRNDIRHNVLPQLEKIRPDSSLQFAKLSEKAVDVESILFDMAAMDLALVSEHYDFCPLDQSYGLSLKRLHVLSVPRQLNALKYWLESVGYPANSEMDLLTLIDWSIRDVTSGAQLQRNERIYRYYRGVVYVMPAQAFIPEFIDKMAWVSIENNLDLSQSFNGQEVYLTFINELVDDAYSSDKDIGVENLSIMTRKSAEVLKLRNSHLHINTKNILQEYGVPVWRRDKALFVSNDKGECIAVVGGQKVVPFSLKTVFK